MKFKIFNQFKISNLKFIKIFLAGVLLLASLGFTVATVLMVGKFIVPGKNTPAVVDEKSLKTFTIEELKKYDGTDEKLPIYLAMEGYVYDVTAGAEYYKPGGVYHFLAGKDSTTELRVAGGGDN